MGTFRLLSTVLLQYADISVREADVVVEACTWLFIVIARNYSEAPNPIPSRYYLGLSDTTTVDLLALPNSINPILADPNDRSTYANRTFDGSAI